MPPVTVLGALAAVIAPIWSPPAELLVRLAGPALWWMLWVAEHAAALPGASVAVPGGVLGAVVAAVLTMLVVIALRFRATRRVLIAVVVGAVLVFTPSRKR